MGKAMVVAVLAAACLLLNFFCSKQLVSLKTKEFVLLVIIIT